MKLPFVSRKEYGLLNSELANCKRVIQKLQEENCSLNTERISAEKRANRFEEENINLRGCYRDKCLEYQNIKEILDARKELEDRLYDINFKLKKKIDKFEIDTVVALGREKNRHKKSRKKKQKQREIDSFIIDKVLEVVFKVGEIYAK